MMVLHFDYKKHWNQPVNLVDCFDIPEDLKPYVNDYHINLFEIAYLSREQVNLFQSDFKIVADYFVQMRENNHYIPTEDTIKHVEEVLQFMAAMNEDAKFEEAYCREGRGAEVRNYRAMVEAVGEARGEVKGTVNTCREFGMTDEQILDKIMKQFQLTEEEAKEYLK